jgi:hypothetical protein
MGTSALPENSEETLTRTQNGNARYAAWKEQTRQLAVYSKEKVYAMVDYSPASPVRGRPVEHPWRLGFVELAVL